MSQVTLSQLEAHLWEAANILRGPVDASDFKSYIFPLLFFKRLSDVYDEELEATMNEYGVDFPENHRFQIPYGSHWNEIRAITSNVGVALQNAFRQIESVSQVTLPNECSLSDFLPHKMRNNHYLWRFQFFTCHLNGVTIFPIVHYILYWLLIAVDLGILQLLAVRRNYRHQMQIYAYY